MDLKKLEAFCRIVELGSFTKAGQAMHLSQPTISDHIRNLEEEIGHKLINRLGRDVEPTPAGRLLYSHATKIFRLKDETLQALIQFSGKYIGNLIIGASSIPGAYILPKIISDFHLQYPDVTATVRINGSRIIARKVLDGEYDIGLAGAIWNERGLEWEPLFTDTLILVTHPKGLLASRQSIPLREILDKPFVFREPDSGTRKSIAQLLESKGYKETDLHETAQFGSNEAVKEAVKAGVGISIVSQRSVTEELNRGTLIALNLQEVTGARPFYLVTRKNRALQPAASAFVEYLRAIADLK